jgi:hypothetical protein
MLLPRVHAAFARLSEMEGDDHGKRRHTEEARRLFAAQGTGGEEEGDANQTTVGRPLPTVP